MCWVSARRLEPAHNRIILLREVGDESSIEPCGVEAGLAQASFPCKWGRERGGCRRAWSGGCCTEGDSVGSAEVARGSWTTCSLAAGGMAAVSPCSSTASACSKSGVLGGAWQEEAAG